MSTIEITPAPDEGSAPWSRRELLGTGLAGLLGTALLANALPARPMASDRGLPGGAWHSVEDARVIGRDYLGAKPHEADAPALLRALFGTDIPSTTRELRSRLAAARDADFSAGRVLVVRGWLMAVTEARWCALAVFVGDAA